MNHVVSRLALLLLVTASASAQSLPEGARALRNLAYVANGHERHKLDLYLPANTNSPVPLIIWVHGGAWSAGSKERPPGLRFLSRGYAVASINYRLSQHAVFPAQIEDCKAAVRWLRTHASEYGLDPGRFGAWGASAGGHLVALLGTAGDVKEFDTGEHLEVSSRVQAVVDFFGPTDLLRMDEQLGDKGTFKHDAPDSPESRLLGGPLQENKEKARRANPIPYVSAGDCPMLIVHGDADPLVPWQQSELLHEALKKAGVRSTLHLVKGGGHGTGFGPDVDKLVDEFFEQELRQTRD
ncbi:MAG TPA: alpha/beta hydrolase [Verrucomicrobia bacterium]|nr:alpha/beta hydrolase [Verrucomicrobiota bacterium]HOP97579.1 alpha/beta hydrolase [Verrucomicrobiota bacterium]